MTERPDEQDADIAAEPDAVRRHAAAMVMDCRQALARSGQSVLTELLRDTPRFEQWSHVPEGDVRDPTTGALFYYHAHEAGEQENGEHGHFHTFVTVEDRGAPAIVHLVAISMDAQGAPRHLFTTNRWVTGEAWRPAATTIGLLERFVVDVVRPSWVVSRFVTALVRFYRPTIAELLIERDAALGARDGDPPDPAVLEDRGRMTLSQRAIDLDADIRAVLRR